MNFTYLKYFIDVVNEGSVQQSSIKNFVSQPAISQGIRKLEENLEIQLLHHQRNNIQITREGIKLHKAATMLFKHIRDFDSEVNKIKNLFSGKLIIGISNSLVSVVLTPMIARFSNAYPEIDIEIKVGKTSYQKELIENGSIDLGITIDDGNLDSYKKKVLRKGSFKLIGHKNSAKKLLLTENRPETTFLEKTLQDNPQEDLNSRVVIESWGTILELSKSGYGYGFLPDFVCRDLNSLVDFSKKYSIPTVKYRIVSFFKPQLNTSSLLKVFSSML